VICEKPSQAQAYAAVLNARKREDGFLHGNGWIVSWCFGHLVELANADNYSEQYKEWNLEHLPILPENWYYKTSKNKAKQLEILRKLMNRADVDGIVCATDAGREGELIFRLVYDYCKCKKSIQRLWISSMEDSAIRDGFANLRSGAEYDNLYHSALCRAKADWLVGINATRLFSCLYGATLNVGRVQTPTLALLVEREKSIREFVSEPFYIPEISCGEFTASSEKLKDFKDAGAVQTAVNGQDAIVLSVEKTNKTVAPPKLYDLTTLQREANRLFGYTAQETLDYVQALYEKKLVTYPRTDSRYLTDDMAADIPELIKVAGEIAPLQPIGAVNVGQVIDNAKVTDHHAIIPTMTVRESLLSTLPTGEKNILKMLAKRLIEAVGDKHIYDETVVTFDCGGNIFTLRGSTVVDAGWKTEKADEEDVVLPEFTKGQVLSAVSASVKEGKSAPPRPYTEDTLLSAMETAGTEDMPDDAERKGLGTPATRAATIEKLVKSGFVKRHKKNIIPTDKGVNLIAVLPEVVKSPLLTAEWEQKLKLIERGELTDSEFMDGIAALTRSLVDEHSAPLPEYKELFDTARTVKGGVSIGACPRCGDNVVEGKKSFYCTSRQCSFSLWKEHWFFVSKGKKITKSVAAAFLKEGYVFFLDLFSKRIGKNYAAAIVLEDIGGKMNFSLDFDKAGGGVNV